MRVRSGQKNIDCLEEKYESATARYFGMLSDIARRTPELIGKVTLRLGR